MSNRYKQILDEELESAVQEIISAKTSELSYWYGWKKAIERLTVRFENVEPPKGE